MLSALQVEPTPDRNPTEPYMSLGGYFYQEPSGGHYKQRIWTLLSIFFATNAHPDGAAYLVP